MAGGGAANLQSTAEPDPCAPEHTSSDRYRYEISMIDFSNAISTRPMTVLATPESHIFRHVLILGSEHLYQGVDPEGFGPERLSLENLVFHNNLTATCHDVASTVPHKTFALHALYRGHTRFHSGAVPL